MCVVTRVRVELVFRLLCSTYVVLCNVCVVMRFLSNMCLVICVRQLNYIFDSRVLRALWCVMRAC
jgi:hypothetical protein